jgi:hypothetical protein
VRRERRRLCVRPSGTRPLSRKVDETADAVRTERAVGEKDVVRGYAETRHRAGSWHKERRAIARIEATRLGLDVRFVVTNLDRGSAERLYETLYCARGRAENLIKLHKAQLASDRTSCRSALANQVRLVLHTAAYWLMLAVRDAIPKERDLAKAEFATLRLKLLKIAARVVEMASRVLWPKVGEGVNRGRQHTMGVFEPPLLHRRSDMPCSMITSSN